MKLFADDPRLDVGPINPDGKIKLVFNQDMLIPNSLTPSELKYVVVFSIVSDEDGSITYGRIVNHNDLLHNQTASTNNSSPPNRTLLQLVNDAEKENADFKDKSFNVTVESIEQRQIEF